MTTPRCKPRELCVIEPPKGPGVTDLDAGIAEQVAGLVVTTVAAHLCEAFPPALPAPYHSWDVMPEPQVNVPRRCRTPSGRLIDPGWYTTRIPDHWLRPLRGTEHDEPAAVGERCMADASMEQSMIETTRRGFLGSLLALAAAPAIVRADSLMRVVAPRALMLWGDGVHDDTLALQAFIDGRGVVDAQGRSLARELPSGDYLVTGTLDCTKPHQSLRARGSNFTMPEWASKRGPMLRVGRQGLNEFHHNVVYGGGVGWRL